jgi:TPP-dependent pyruvate/acetoin dehydrogenase alpha subunit
MDPSAAATPDERLYETMALIRAFEQTVLDRFATGAFYGTTHTYLGQEADAAGVLDHLVPGDLVVSNHRCHGHFLAFGGDPRALFAEMMGRSTGVCGGRGGSQHLHWNGFMSNGILGSTAPVATGMALAEKHRGSGAITVAFLGDGALGEGVVYESLNLASLWGAPILYVVENNGIAQTTPASLGVAGSMPARFEAFGIAAVELDTSDVFEIHALAGELLAEVRSTRSPRALVLHTCRFGPHSKSDDTRPTADVERMRAERDPLTIHAPRVDEARRHEIEVRVTERIALAFEQALADPEPSLAGRLVVSG